MTIWPQHKRMHDKYRGNHSWYWRWWNYILKVHFRTWKLLKPAKTNRNNNFTGVKFTVICHLIAWGQEWKTKATGRHRKFTKHHPRQKMIGLSIKHAWASCFSMLKNHRIIIVDATVTPKIPTQIPSLQPSLKHHLLLFRHQREGSQKGTLALCFLYVY